MAVISMIPENLITILGVPQGCYGWRTSIVGRESEWRRGEFDERGEADGGARTLGKPVAQPAHIQDSGGEDVLEPSLGQVDVAGVAQISHAQSLAGSSLDAGSGVLALLELLGLLVASCRLQRQVLVLGPDGDLPRPRLGPGALCAEGVGPAGGSEEADVDDWVAAVVVRLGPCGAGHAARSCSQLMVKLIASKPSPARLPMGVLGHRPTTSTWCSCWLATRRSAGSSSRSASAWWMGGSIATTAP